MDAPYGGFFPVVGSYSTAAGCATSLKRYASRRGKQMCLGRADLRRKLLERGNVVQNPEAAPVSGHRQIVEPLLNGQPVDRRVRQAGLSGCQFFPSSKETYNPPSVPR